jgi:RES domain-containing protein
MQKIHQPLFTKLPLNRVYRVLRKAYAASPLDGEGAFLYGGRWSSPGIRLAYTSEHQSLAMLEYFVHLDAEAAPADLVLVTAEIPNDVSKLQLSLDQLPSRWRMFPAPAELTTFGDEFARKNERCILIVPSAQAPGENNWLLNPQHSEFRKVVVSGVQPLRYDSRMFESKSKMFKAHRRTRPRT